MKNAITRIKHFRPATIIALLALFVAIGGTATAASGLISGKKIKPGTLTAKQLKKKTITTNKLAPATVAALRGPQGAQGEKGDKGITGPQGPDGPKVLNSYSTTGNLNNVPANDKVTV